MVLKGQFLERPTLIPVDDVVLEGMAHRGARRPPLLVVPPRPAEGGGMDHVLAAELVFAAVRAGHPTVCFNHRGVGGSQGARGSGLALVDDARAALQLAAENAGADAVAVAAVAGGGLTALQLRRLEPRVAGVCIVGPADLAPEDLAGLGVPLLVVAGEGDPALASGELARTLAAAGGRLARVAGADARFSRSLPQVGHAVAAWLADLGHG
jgi:uncharacterized protein